MQSKIAELFTSQSKNDIEKVETIIENIANDINQGHSDLIKLVEDLEPQLISADPFERAKGVSSFINVMGLLTSIPKKFGSVLCTFLLDRLEDKTCVPHVANGFLYLLKQRAMASDEIIAAVSKILVELDVQAYPQVTRRSIYQVILFVLQTENPQIIERSIPNLFMSIISIMDGERDPRNLIFTFQIIQAISSLMDIRDYAEELFDAFFCYFPITIRAPSQGTDGVQPEDLKKTLLSCFCSCAEFGRFALPLLMEKLTSTSVHSKRDTIVVLSQVSEIYSEISDYAIDIWQEIRLEIYQPKEEDLREKSLQLVHQLLKSLSKTVMGSRGSTLTKLLEAILAEITENIQGDLATLHLNYIPLLVKAVTASCDSACFITLKKVIPHVLNRINDLNKQNDKNISILLRVLFACIEGSSILFANSFSADGESKSTPIENFLDDLKNTFVGRLKSDVVSDEKWSELGMEGLFLLIKTRQLSESQKLFVLEKFQTYILNNGCSIEFKKMLVKMLLEWSTIDSDFVLDNLIRPIFSSISSSSLQMKNHTSDLLIEMANSRALVNPILNLYLKFLKNQDMGSTSTAALSIFASILHVSVTGHSSVEIDVENVFNQELIDYSISLLSALSKGDADAPMDRDHLSIYKKFFMGVLRISKTDRLLPLANDIILDEGSYSKVSLLMALSIISNSYPSKDLGTYGQQLLPFLYSKQWSMLAVGNETEGDITGIQEAWLTCLGLLMNKIQDDTLIQPIIQDVQQQTDLHTISKISFMLKGLVMKMHKYGFDLLDVILDALLVQETHQVAKIVLERLFITGGDEDLFSKETFCFFSRLYKQRVFQVVTLKLLDSYAKSENKNKQAIMYTLFRVMRSVGSLIIQPYLPKLFPLVLDALTFEDPEIIKMAVTSLHLILKENKGLILDHCAAIVQRVLNLSVSSQQSDVSIRVKSIEFLGSLPKAFSYEKLHPFKQKIITQMAESLEDHKRLVRQQAADTRMKWYLFMGSTSAVEE